MEGLQYLDLSGNSLTGSIPPELGSLANLSYLSLYSNQLSGSIPGEIGSLTNLQTLMLFQNQLSGPIPAALGSLTSLFICHLGGNQLSGPIPAALSGLTGAQQIVLSSNRLTGPIPAELGSLTGLMYLYLNGNQLSGSIPTALTGMVSMEPGGLNLGYNALYAADPTLVAFLNTKNPGWASTQTITPTEITATALDGARILVSWLPIAYTADAGSYRIFSSVDPGGPYSFAGQTADKSASAAEVSGLTPGETYYFVVRAHTDAHANNPSAVESEDSSEASAVAWTRINPRIAGVVRVGSSPLPGVVMSGLAGNPVTDSNGAYDVTVAAGWSGTVTPTLAGYTFDPAFRAYSVLPDDQLAQDYAATQITFTVSGTVTVGSTALAGVTMAGLPHSPVTDASGYYADAVPYGWSGTVTPTHSYYAFDPASQVYANVTSDQTGRNYSASLITTTQRQALIAFYNSTNGDGWTNKSGWKTPPLYPDGFAMPGTEGTWFGVSVNPETLAVTGITLVGNNLTGSIPAGLATLADLQVLNLFSNHLSGSIPVEMGNLTSLSVLSFGYNQLSGSIPAELANLANLNDLELNNNQLSGSIPAELGTLTNLRYLELNSNLLSGSIPVELGDLADLLHLNLYENQLTGSIPPELGNLTNVETLFLYTNELSGSIPVDLGRLTNLTQLGLHANHLTGSIPAELGALVRLDDLYLAGNQLTGPIPAELGNLTNLEVLWLSSNQLTGSIPATLGNITRLYQLNLDSNLLSGPIPVELGNFPHLEYLRLQSNQLSGSIPAALSTLSTLRGLNLRANQLSGDIPTSLANLTNLTDGFSDIGYNALYASDQGLITFLNLKDPDWATTQTIAPTQVTATSLDNAEIMVSWLPITYTGDTGSYKVLMSETAGGPYTLAGETADKTTSAVNVTGLTPGQRYYFVVRTVTNAHANNANIVESGNSAEASTVAWTQINVQITGTILAGGLPLANVLMAGLPGTVVTNASGVYDASVAAGSSPTVTPTLEGYSFVPVSRAYTTVTEDQIAQDYTATAIVAPTITVVSPNGGEAWGIGSIHTVTWGSTGGITNVKLEYSVNGGADWTTIIETTSNSGSYPGPFRAQHPGSALSRVSDAADLGVTDLSDSVFSIIQAIPGSERQALIDLYNSTNGESWSTNSGWKTAPLYTDGFAMPGTEGTWFGVVVDSGRVILLDPGGQ